MSEPKHTPTPYAVAPPSDPENYSGDWEIHDGMGRTATIHGEADDPETQATAEFIVRACNSHEALCEALERTLSWLTSYPGGGPLYPGGAYEQARATLKLARGES